MLVGVQDLRSWNEQEENTKVLHQQSKTEANRTITFADVLVSTRKNTKPGISATRNGFGTPPNRAEQFVMPDSQKQFQIYTLLLNFLLVSKGLTSVD